jgi:archaellum component FlaG (FlaF/FlaG flagellin family)
VVCTIGPFDWEASVMCMFFGWVVCSTAVASTLCKEARSIVGGMQCESYQNNRAGQYDAQPSIHLSGAAS